MFLMYLRLPHRRNSSSNGAGASNSRPNRSGPNSHEAASRSPQIQQQQTQQRRQIEATYYLERRLFL